MVLGENSNCRYSHHSIKLFYKCNSSPDYSDVSRLKTDATTLALIEAARHAS